MIEQTISIERIEDVIDIFGSFDENITHHRARAGRLGGQPGRPCSRSPAESRRASCTPSRRAIESLLALAGRKGEAITEQNVRYIIQLVQAGREEPHPPASRGDVLCVTAKGKPIKPKTLGQKRYVDAIREEHRGHPGHRPGGHRQDLPGGGRRRGRLPGQAGQPHHPHPPGGGGRRAAGLPPRRPAEQGGPLSPAPVRRPLRHAGRGDL